MIVIFNPAVLNYAVDFARPDIFMVLLTMVAVFLIYKERMYILVPFLCVIGMLIHEGFIVNFVPLIATYMLDKIIKKPSAKKILTFILLVVLCFATFFLVLKYGKNGISNVEGFQAMLQEKIDIELNPNMVYFEFGSVKGELSGISFNELAYYKTQLGLMFYLCLFLPIIIPYVMVLKRCFENAKNKFVYVLYGIAPFSGLLMIVVGVDYGRWFSMLISCCLIRLFYLLREQHVSIEECLKFRDISKLIIICAIILGIYLVIGPMGDIYEHFDYLNFINNMFNYFKGILA